VSNVLWRIGIGVGNGYVAFGFFGVGFSLEDFGFFPSLLPFLLDLFQKCHKGFWIRLWTIKGFVNIY
jgi:hypothetical protein